MQILTGGCLLTRLVGRPRWGIKAYNENGTIAGSFWVAARSTTDGSDGHALAHATRTVDRDNGVGLQINTDIHSDDSAEISVGL